MQTLLLSRAVGPPRLWALGTDDLAMFEEQIPYASVLLWDTAAWGAPPTVLRGRVFLNAPPGGVGGGGGHVVGGHAAPAATAP